jgi:hypothetical protein
MVDEIDGHPVRNKKIAETILLKHDELSKEFIKACIDAGCAEEFAILIADEMKLMSKQSLLGRYDYERPAFYPKDRWELVRSNGN